MAENSWLKARQTRYGAYAAIYILVVLAVVGVGNWVASGHTKSIDVTASKQYTLSDQTTKVVSGLKNDINVYYFDRSANYESARDILDRYASLSTHLKISYVDPEKKPDVARVEGVHSMGDVIIDSGIKKETAKALTEEELTGAIIRSIKTATHTVCFVKGSGEHSVDDTDREGYSGMKDAFEKNNYKTQAISLLEKPEVPQECTVVIVGGPKHDYLAPAVTALKTFVTNGGRLIVNLDPILKLPPPEEKLGDAPALAALIAEWGIATKGDVVIDQSAASQVFGAISPVVETYSQHPIVRVMNGNVSVMPIARSLEVKAPAQTLFSSSNESVSLMNPNLPIHEADMAKGAKGPFVLGAAATIGTGDKAGRVVVVGSSSWMANSLIGASIGNRDLALNMLNWLTSDEDLISIRPKQPDDRRLNITANGVKVLFLESIVAIPLFIILMGVSVWWKRR